MQLAKETKVPVLALVKAEQNNDFCQSSSVFPLPEDAASSNVLLTSIQKYWPQCQAGHMTAILAKYNSEVLGLPVANNGTSKVDQHRRIALAYCTKVVQRCGDVVPLLIKEWLLNEAPQRFQQHLVRKMDEIGFDELRNAESHDSKKQVQLQKVRDLVSSLQTAKAAFDECFDVNAAVNAPGLTNLTTDH
jgi:hypothetical protein